MKVSEILTGVLELFSDAKHWAQGYYAYTGPGSKHRTKQMAGIKRYSHPDRVPARADVASCWCLLGGIQKINGGDNYPAESVLEKTLGTTNLADWNDAPERKIGEVRTLLKRAITLARDEEAQAAQRIHEAFAADNL